MAQMNASARPVFPEVASMMVVSLLIFPSFSAAAIMYDTGRSLILYELNISSLAASVASASTETFAAAVGHAPMPSTVIPWPKNLTASTHRSEPERPLRRGFASRRRHRARCGGDGRQELAAASASRTGDRGGFR